MITLKLLVKGRRKIRALQSNTRDFPPLPLVYKLVFLLAAWHFQHLGLDEAPRCEVGTCITLVVAGFPFVAILYMSLGCSAVEPQNKLLFLIFEMLKQVFCNSLLVTQPLKLLWVAVLQETFECHEFGQAGRTAPSYIWFYRIDGD